MYSAPMLSVFIQDLSRIQPSEIAELYQLLDDGEQAKVARFARPANRTEYIIAHSLKRRVLGAMLGCAPRTLRFSTVGKPTLLGGPAQLDFNISHAEGAVACAISLGARVGVDIEPERRNRIPDIASSVFSPLELAWLDSQEGGRLGPSFLALWTLKEAYVKALGTGLSLDLLTFAVSVSPPELLDDGHSLSPGQACHLYGCRLDSGHVVALATIAEACRPETPPHWHIDLTF